MDRGGMRWALMSFPIRTIGDSMSGITFEVSLRWFFQLLFHGILSCNRRIYMQAGLKKRGVSVVIQDSQKCTLIGSEIKKKRNGLLEKSKRRHGAQLFPNTIRLVTEDIAKQSFSDMTRTQQRSWWGQAIAVFQLQHIQAHTWNDFDKNSEKSGKF